MAQNVLQHTDTSSTELLISTTRYQCIVSLLSLNRFILKLNKLKINKGHSMTLLSYILIYIYIYIYIYMGQSQKYTLGDTLYLLK